MSNEIDLKKYGLKEIKFSELIDGDEFNTANDFSLQRMNPPEFYKRKIAGKNIIYADGTPTACSETVAEFLTYDMTVFVKV